MRQLSRFFLFLPVIFLSCKSTPDEAPKKPAEIPKPKTVIQPVAVDTSFHYTKYPLTGSSSLQFLSDSIGRENMMMVLKLNRLDLKHCKAGDTLLLPSSFSDSSALSPFPLQFDSTGGITKIIFVSRKQQVFAVYDSGKLVRWGPTSTGKKKTPTPDGLYFTNWKKDTAISTVDPSWILPWCTNIENFMGISFHQYDLPGYPASHSCIRLLAEDAEWIYQWAEVWKLTPDRKQVAQYGTPIIIFDEYSYGKKPLWKKVVKDPNIAKVSVEELQNAFAKYRNTITEKKRVVADSVLTQK